MSRLCPILGLACALSVPYATAFAAPKADDALRIASLGAAVTETVAALGCTDQVVAIDSTSAGILADDVKDLGFYKRITATGVLAVKANLVLATHGAGLPATFDQLRRTKVRVVNLPRVNSTASAIDQIGKIARAVDRKEAGEKLVDGIKKTLDALKTKTAGQPPVKMLFVYARGAGAMLVGGRNTTADTMIELIGGTNVASAFDNYKPFSPEVLLAEGPEVLLLTQHGYDALGGKQALQIHPVLSKLPAVQRHAIIVRPARELLSFGPRFADRAAELAEAIEVFRPKTHK